jgi:hypothetical protein
LKMGIFHGYVSLPEGTGVTGVRGSFSAVSGRVESRLDQDSISGTENFVGMLPAINRLEGFVARFGGFGHDSWCLENNRRDVH